MHASKYNYQIRVEFKTSNKECAIGKVYSKYLNGQNQTDTFRFFQKHFILNATRSKVYEDGTILSNSGNSINRQIIKGVLLHYSLATTTPQIKNIIIIRKRIRSPHYTYLQEASHLIQPITGNRKIQLQFDKKVLTSILDETPRADAIRIALSYWLKGISSEERYYKFDNLWRSFNRLCLFNANTIKDFEGLRKMRELIINSQASFQNTINIIKNYTIDDLSKFRWKVFSSNEYNIVNKASALKDFILRYNDARIMDLFDKVIVPCRRQLLIQQGFFLDVNRHIKSQTQQIDIEIVTILAIKYAYWLRNKFFHGAIYNRTFKLHTDNIDDEVDILNNILSSLIFEIINNDKIRV